MIMRPSGPPSGAVHPDVEKLLYDLAQLATQINGLAVSVHVETEPGKHEMHTLVVGSFRKDKYLGWKAIAMLAENRAAAQLEEQGKEPDGRKRIVTL